MKLIHQERHRADRSGIAFAVIAFTPISTAPARPVCAALVDALAQRIRTTDALGWLAEGVLAVILPHTGLSGAYTVCKDVSTTLPPDLPLPRYSVYIYPHNPEKLEQELAECHASEFLGTAQENGPLEPFLAAPMPPLKRAIDILGAGLGLLLLLPLLLLVALLIKLTSRGPVLFFQLRSGRGGRPFWMIKFRTMVPDAAALQAKLRARSEQDGPAFKMKNDPRITWLGRFLRKTSLDELPQLWNVLVGDMSLVGPRPLPVAETAACEPWQRRRLDVTPGLTCIWQVRGRSKVSFVEWMRMDLQYVRSQSLPQDLKLLMLTVPAVLMQRGAQ
jgi:lipopolysaccharide/colanic/teichoic acid biosynthesis glycosyltransferase